MKCLEELGFLTNSILCLILDYLAVGTKNKLKGDADRVFLYFISSFHRVLYGSVP